MTLRLHPVYQELIEKANRSHEKNRNPEGITAEDVDRRGSIAMPFAGIRSARSTPPGKCFWRGRARRRWPPHGGCRAERGARRHGQPGHGNRAPRLPRRDLRPLPLPLGRDPRDRQPRARLPRLA